MSNLAVLGEAESLRGRCEELTDELSRLADARREAVARAGELARSLAEWEARAEELRRERDGWHVRVERLKQESADVRALRRGAEARAELFMREAVEHRQAAERLTGECDRLRDELAVVRAELAALRGSRLVRWGAKARKMLIPAEVARALKRRARRVLHKVRSRGILPKR